MINVLIIDDESKICLFFEAIIKKMGYTPPIQPDQLRKPGT